MSDWETNGGGYQKIYGEDSAGTSVVMPINGDAVTVAGPLVTTWVHTSVTFGSAGTNALPANTDRKYALFINDSIDTIYLRLGAGTVAVNEGIRLNVAGNSGDRYSMSRAEGNLYTGLIQAIHAGSADRTLLITEGD